jgi:hypothetical protein
VHSDSLRVSFQHPTSWRSLLQPLGLHYDATFAFLANFPLRQFCHQVPNSFTCLWADLGPYPAIGVLMTFGTFGYGPGPMSRQELLGPGAHLKVGGRTARRRVSDGVGCLGTGAQHAVSYTVVDGEPQGIFGVTFCYRGPPRRQLTAQIDRVMRTMRIAPGPPGVGAQPG